MVQPFASQDFFFMSSVVMALFVGLLVASVEGGSNRGLSSHIQTLPFTILTYLPSFFVLPLFVRPTAFT